MRLPLIPVIVLLTGARASLDVVPGATWTAAGLDQHMQAHGAGITEVDGTYYIIGENKLNGSSFQSINCYSSTDLINWTFENELLTLESSGDLGPNRVVERPKVIYNDATSKYVMWLHIDSADYSEAKAGVATGSSVCGDYTYLGSSQPLGFQSRDIGLYKDTDGAAYLLTEDRANGLRIDRLSSDYLSVTSNVHLFPDSYEAPAIHKSGGTYFLFASQLTGWSPNDNRYCTATNLAGPWTDWTNFAPSGTNTFDSQTTFVLDVNGLIIYMGDRWLSNNLASSTYIWLPLTISGTTASIADDSPWTPSLGSGTWSYLSSTRTILAGSGDTTLGGSAVILSCSGCSADIVGYLGGPDDGTLTFNSVSVSRTGGNTVQISYGNGDSTQRYCTVVVNGEAHVVAFLPTGGPQSLATSVLNANFDQTNGNVIEFQAWNGEYCPDINGITVS